jgi:hypothetical protein
VLADARHAVDGSGPPPVGLATRLRSGALAAGRDLLVPVVTATTVALALIPLPRLVAWGALLGLAAAFGRITRTMGMTAAAASCLLFMALHGRPRFATEVTDPWTIRLSFLLGILGASAAALTSWHAGRTRAGAQRSLTRSTS